MAGVTVTDIGPDLDESVSESVSPPSAAGGDGEGDADLGLKQDGADALAA